MSRNRKDTREIKNQRGSAGLGGQIKATAGRIRERIEHRRRSDRAVDALMSPVYLVADVLYIAPQMIYLVVLVAAFIVTIPFQACIYIWLFFSS